MKLFICAVLLLAVCSAQGKSVASDDVLANTHFLLWNRYHPTEYKELEIGDAAILNEARYDISLPTMIFIHGFLMNGHDDEKVLQMRDAYLERQDCNFISVDWQKLAEGPNYPQALSNVGPVGVLTADLITFLNKQGTAIEKFHLIGFSLGAHVAGKAAATVDFVVSRVTGLDPAYPGFSMEDTDNRLDTSDALFVDVIHTNSGSSIQTSISFPQAIGHADFFVNGGASQPGCGIISGGFTDLIKGCSHGRALEYFTESINSPVGFTAELCDSWRDFTSGKCHGTTNQMGEPIDDSNWGVFYSATNKESPYAKKL